MIWFHSITHPDYLDGDHPATLKKMFLTRWSLKGKTADVDVGSHPVCFNVSNDFSIMGYLIFWRETSFRSLL